MPRTDQMLHKSRPLGQIRLARVQLQKLTHQRIHPLPPQNQRQFIHTVVHIHLLNHRIRSHIAENRQLLAQLLINRMLGAAHKNLRLNANLTQLRHRLLRRFRLQLARRLDVRHQRHVNKQYIVATCLEGKLTQRLKKWQAFNVPSRPANFRDDDIRPRSSPDFANAVLDLVGHMRNHLDRLS